MPIGVIPAAPLAWKVPFVTSPGTGLAVLLSGWA
jgi:hypothetical protein